MTIRFSAVMFLTTVPTLTVALVTLGFTLYALRRRRLARTVLPVESGPLVRRTTLAARLASAVASGGIAFLLFAPTIGLIGWRPLTNDSRVVYALPLAVGVVALLVMLALPTGARSISAKHGVDASPRSIASFTSRWWATPFLIVYGLLIVTTVVAGLASSPDDAGRLRLLRVDVGNGGWASTTMFGWWYGGPVLLASVLLVLVALGMLALTARPPLAGDAALHAAQRQLRKARNGTIAFITIGSLAYAVGSTWLSLHSSLQLAVYNPGAGMTDTPAYATLSPALDLGGALLRGIGLGLVLVPLVFRLHGRPAAAAPVEAEEPA